MKMTLMTMKMTFYFSVQSTKITERRVIYMAKNRVIAGAYQGKLINQALGSPYIQIGFLKTLELKGQVTNYEILDATSTKSASSAVLRGAIGATLLGPVGLLAGLSAKNKKSKLIALKFKDGQECVVDVDDKVYRAILKTLVGVKSTFDESSPNQLENKSEISVPDEILKFKDLMDKGIISEEEFQAKKKQLLNL